MLTQARLKELLLYDPITGLFTRKKKSGRFPAGSIIGGKDNGYVVILVDGKVYGAHRLAWLYMTGVMPIRMIDHKNTVRSDNSWTNLREATNAQNLGNRPANRNNTSGYKGVTWNKQVRKWKAQITLNGKNTVLGGFEKPEDAHKAYLVAAKHHFGEFAKG